MQPQPQQSLKWWERSLGLDVRSLAFLRISLGLYTTADAIQRALEARFYYSDFGVLPRAALSEYLNRWLFSLNLLNDTVGWQLALIAVIGLAGLAMAVGYRTTLATVVAWVLTVSIHNRNEIVLDGGDSVHRMLLFWMMFLPLGAVWSIDSLKRPWAGPGNTVSSVGAAGFKIQMAIIFVFAAMLKTGDPWRKNFDAAWYALNYEVYTTQFGIWLRQYPEFLRWMTRASLIIEGVVPFALFIPVAPVQVLTILILLSLNLGFALCMHLIMFSGVMIIGWLSLTPGWLWDKLGIAPEIPQGWRGRLTALADRLPGAGCAPWIDEWPWLARRLSTFFLIYILIWNVRTLHPPNARRPFPAGLSIPGFILRIDQRWDMFAPKPITETGWLVVPGKLAGGGMVDLFRDGAPLNWDRPPSVADTYKNRRGRKFYWAVTSTEWPDARKQYARYLCRTWPEQSAEVLESVQIVLMHSVARPDLSISVPDKMLVWKQDCK